MMTYQERLDDYIRYEAWGHMQNLCRELIAERKEWEEGVAGMRLAIGDLRGERDKAEAELARLRKRDDVVVKHVQNGSNALHSSEWQLSCRYLNDKLAAIEEEKG